MAKRWALVTLAAVLAVALLAALERSRRPESPIDRAQRLVGDATNFDTGREAGDTLVSAANELLEQARGCIAERGETPYCLSFRTGAAWSNVAGVKALTCRAPGRFALRQTAVGYYATLERLSPSVTTIGNTPALPDCD